MARNDWGAYTAESYENALRHIAGTRVWLTNDMAERVAYLQGVARDALLREAEASLSDGMAGVGQKPEDACIQCGDTTPCPRDQIMEGGTCGHPVYVGTDLDPLLAAERADAATSGSDPEADGTNPPPPPPGYDVEVRQTRTAWCWQVWAADGRRVGIDRAESHEEAMDAVGRCIREHKAGRPREERYTITPGPSDWRGPGNWLVHDRKQGVGGLVAVYRPDEEHLAAEHAARLNARA